VEKADHYGVLGIGRDVTPAEIKSAYRREALRWHPDRNPGDPEAEERFKAASAAYEVLREPDKRRAYDMELAGFGREAALGGYGRGRGRGRRCGGGRGRRCAKGFGRGFRAGGWFGPSPDLIVDVTLGLVEAAMGCEKRIAVDSPGGRDVLDLRIPPGIGDGDVVRLHGLGPDNTEGLRGDLYLRINISAGV